VLTKRIYHPYVPELEVSAPGDITVYDLEVPEITSSILVEPQSDMDRQLVQQLAVDIDGESLMLTFDLAIIQDIFGMYFPSWFLSEFNVYT
jgi:hypothetical protein